MSDELSQLRTYARQEHIVSDLLGRLKLIRNWHRRGGPTPKAKCPSIFKAVSEAIAVLEVYEVRPCVNRLGNQTGWDICHPAEPDATGIAVVATVYQSEEVARIMATALRAAFHRPKEVA